jgi:hypothetical protein
MSLLIAVVQQRLSTVSGVVISSGMSVVTFIFDPVRACVVVVTYVATNAPIITVSRMDDLFNLFLLQDVG